MKHLHVIPAVVAAALTLAGCANQCPQPSTAAALHPSAAHTAHDGPPSAAADATHSDDPHANHEAAKPGADHDPHTAAPASDAPAARIIELPAAAGEGKPREAKVLVDHPKLKLASIVLRQGTPLPMHSATIPVTIMALQGSGMVVVGDERFPIDATHAVMLEANVRHSVEPAEGSDMLLLVHHLGQGEEHHE